MGVTDIDHTLQAIINIVFFCVLIFIIIVIVSMVLIGLVKKFRVKRILAKYSNLDSDKVILHTVWRAKTLPTVSPFGMKLETYLRMANIPYEMETKDAVGPKGKIPWITYKGEHVADTHLIIQFLNKKCSVNLNKLSTSEQVGAAGACRIMLEEHFVWGMLRYRFMDNPSILPQLLKLPSLLKLLLPLQARSLKKRMVQQGIGMHEESEIYQMTEDDLHKASGILGQNKFFGGEEPCEDDCGIFGMVSQAVWGLPGSSFERLVHGELTNLKEYCDRMKDQYWPDWERCLDKSDKP